VFSEELSISTLERGALSLEVRGALSRDSREPGGGRVAGGRYVVVAWL